MDVPAPLMDLPELERRLDALARNNRHHQPADRFDFEIDERVVGSVSVEDARLLAAQVPGLILDDGTLSVLPVCAPDAPAVLQSVAQVLRAAGRTGKWRDEALPVCADDGSLMGHIERACVRTLGIRTFAVHLIGQLAPAAHGSGSPRFWLQRRALDKDVDPGKLDTLAGGLVGMNREGSAREAFDLALIREVEEEAGLTPQQYDRPRQLGSWRVQRPVAGGFMIEDIIVARASLHEGVIPANQDGEVAEFLCVDQADLLARLDRGELTTEAAIATLMSLIDIARP